jgi:hypothetical protein
MFFIIYFSANGWSHLFLEDAFARLSEIECTPLLAGTSLIAVRLLEKGLPPDKVHDDPGDRNDAADSQSNPTQFTILVTCGTYASADNGEHRRAKTQHKHRHRPSVDPDGIADPRTNQKGY